MVDAVVDALARTLSAAERDMQHYSIPGYGPNQPHRRCIVRDRPAHWWLAGDATLAECAAEVIAACAAAAIELPPGIRHAPAIVDLVMGGPERSAGKFAPAAEWSPADFEVAASAGAQRSPYPAATYFVEAARAIDSAASSPTTFAIRPELAAQISTGELSLPVRIGLSADQLVGACMTSAVDPAHWVLVAALSDPAAHVAALMSMAFMHAANSKCAAPRMGNIYFPVRGEPQTPPIDWRSVAAAIATRLRPVRMPLPPVLI